WAVGRECWGAAGEEPAEPLSGHWSVAVALGGGPGEPLEELGLAGERARGADPVDRSVPGGGGQPRRGIVRRAVDGPALDGSRQRILEGVLGKLEVAEDANQCRQDATPVLANDLLEVGRAQCSITGLISIAPPVRAAGILAATSIASSRLSASIR